MPAYLPRKQTPEEQQAAHEQRVRAARSAMLEQMLKDAADG